MFLRKFNKFRHSLMFRLTVMYAVTFAILSSIGLLVFYYRIYSVSMQNLDHELYAETQKYADVMSASGIEGVKSAVPSEAQLVDPEEDFYRLFDFKGETLITTNMATWGTIAKERILRQMREKGLRFHIQTLAMAYRDEKARMITAIIGPDTVIQIGESMEEVDEYLDMFLQLFAILAISLIGVSTLIGWLLARRATTDMNEVIATAEEISNGDYNRRVRLGGQLTEVERLGATFNRMLDRIHGLLKSMREINDNIAHDLRSPLARIRGIAEMSLLQETSNEDYKDMAASTIEECDALIDMINTMLDITEAEAGVDGRPEQSADLVELIHDACELFRPIAQRKKVMLAVDLPKSLMIKSDRKKIQRIITNLLENAIKYTPEDESVTIAATQQNGSIQIDFKDTGIGISKEDLPYIFDRFYRCDRSRTQGGVGLGLSLVKAYTESLNGTISVESTPDQGSRFKLIFSTPPFHP